MSERTSFGLPLGSEERSDEVGRLVPFARFPLQLLPSHGGQGVVLGPAVVLRLPPLGLDGPFLLELEQGGVERAVIELQAMLARLLDAPRNAVAVQRPEDVD